MGTVYQVLGIHSVPFTEIWLINISKETKELLTRFARAISDIHTGKKSTKSYIFAARWEHFTTGREIDKEVVDGLFHAEEVGNKYFKAFLLEVSGG